MLIFKLDTSSANRVADALADLAKEQRERVIPRVLNDIGDGVYTRVIRQLSEQTGATQKRVRTVVKKKPASAGRPQVEIYARDQFMTLKDFAPRAPSKRQVGRKNVITFAGGSLGVSAAPWGVRHIFPHTFIGPGGQVYKRTGSSRLPIEKLYGPAIPREMLRGNIPAAVEEIVKQRFMPRLKYWHEKALTAVKSKHSV